MILRSTMKFVLINTLLVAPSAYGMVAEIALEKESTIEELQLNGCKPLHIAAFFNEVAEIRFAY